MCVFFFPPWVFRSPFCEGYVWLVHVLWVSKKCSNTIPLSSCGSSIECITTNRIQPISSRLYICIQSRNSKLSIFPLGQAQIHVHSILVLKATSHLRFTVLVICSTCHKQKHKLYTRRKGLWRKADNAEWRLLYTTCSAHYNYETDKNPNRVKFTLAMFFKERREVLNAGNNKTRPDNIKPRVSFQGSELISPTKTSCKKFLLRQESRYVRVQCVCVCPEYTRIYIHDRISHLWEKCSGNIFY